MKRGGCFGMQRYPPASEASISVCRSGGDSGTRSVENLLALSRLCPPTNETNVMYLNFLLAHGNLGDDILTRLLIRLGVVNVRGIEDLFII